VLIGRGGEDTLLGGTGADRMKGGTWDDRIRGGGGNDKLIGGAGDDKLFGQPQNDWLMGGPGDDYLDGGAGFNRLDGGPGRNRCLEGAADTLAGTCDGEGPQITELVVANPSIDTSEADRTVEVELRAVDRLTGVGEDLFSSAWHPGTGQRVYGLLTRISGDSNDGVYSGRIQVPRHSAQGRWVFDFQLRDRAGNYNREGEDELAARGLPTGFEQTGRGDNVPPTIHSLVLDRSSVDSSASDQTIGVTVRASDDFTGIPDQYGSTGVGMSLYHREQNQFNDGRNFERISGTDLDGVYRGELLIRRYSAPGTWELRLGARDRAGNEVVLSPFDMARLGLPDSIQQTGVGDIDPPRIPEFSVSPARIDTTSGPATVSFRLRIVDDLSGIWGDSEHFSLYSNGVPSPLQLSATRTSGDRLDGVYEGEVVVPQGSPHGIWKLNTVLSDSASNIDYVDEQFWTASGFSGGFVNGP
jgi:hypothetical protein